MSEPSATPGREDPAADDTETASPTERLDKDPLRTSRTSSIWVVVVGFGVVLILLAVFILQNTQSVKVSFLGWRWHAPLAVALLAATAGGMLATATAGSLRILQLRRRVRRARKQSRSAR